MDNTGRLPIALKMIGGVIIVIGFFMIFLTLATLPIECQITSGKNFCLSGTLFWGLIIGFSYFIAGWGVLRKNKLAWFFIIPVIAMSLWSFSPLFNGIAPEYILLALTPALLHLGFFFVIVAYRDLYGFKKKPEVT